MGLGLGAVVAWGWGPRSLCGSSSSRAVQSSGACAQRALSCTTIPRCMTAACHSMRAPKQPAHAHLSLRPARRPPPASPLTPYLRALSPLGDHLSYLRIDCEHDQVLGPEDTAALGQALPGLTTVHLDTQVPLPDGTLVSLVRGLPPLVDLQLHARPAEVRAEAVAVIRAVEAQAIARQRTQPLAVELGTGWSRDLVEGIEEQVQADLVQLPDGRPCVELVAGRFCGP